MDKPTIGFIGLGDMGEPMARRLLQHGYPVVSSANRTRRAIEALGKEGLEEVANPADVGAKADILMSIVVDQAQTDAVLRGPNGALRSLRPGSTIVLMSTLSPTYCQNLATELAARDVSVLDSPVSGARMRAEQGTLVITTGGDETALERCRSPLETLGTIHHCGEIGMGMMVKIANNGVAFGTAALLIEMRSVARAYDMHLDRLMEIFGQSTANSFIVQAWDHIAATMPHFIKLGEKDVDLCLEVGAAKGTPMPMLSAWRQIDWRALSSGKF